MRGASLAECHADAPQAYLGVTHHLCPNYFMIGGPGVVLGHNSGLFIGECQINYIKHAVDEMFLKNAKCVQLKEDAMNTYQTWVQHEMKNKVLREISTVLGGTGIPKESIGLFGHPICYVIGGAL